MSPSVSLQNMNICALGKSELISVLRKIDISVPPRNKGRTNDHVERWLIARVLASLGETGALAYPLRVQKSERPDFLITQNGDVSGFEITEAINPQSAQVESLPEAQQENTVIDVGHFKWGKKHRLKKLRDIASRKKLTAAPWVGDAVEREYAQMVSDVILKKTAVLNKAGFNRVPENNLVIYVNQMLPILETKKASAMCSESLQSYWGESSFDHVYVECGSEIHHYSANGTEVIQLNNLWR